MSKYATNPDENQLLPNLLGLKTKEDIASSEFDGFLFAEIKFTEELNDNTIFNSEYILSIHENALNHLYAFAGKYREVNISKSGFAFPSAMFLPQAMNEFDIQILNKLPGSYSDEDKLIKDVAIVHGELLFIHPFREGNGRTARILANLMVRKQGYKGLKFEKINTETFPEYIKAVQLCGLKQYEPMEKIISSIL